VSGVELMVMVGSQFSIKAMAALQHKGVPYHLNKVPHNKVKRLAPGGQVPVLYWHGEEVRDSTEIMKRLDHEVVANPLFPVGNQDVVELEHSIDEDFNPFIDHYRWVDREGFDRSIRKALQDTLPPLVRTLVPPLVYHANKKRFLEKTGLAGEEAFPRLSQALASYDRRLQDTAYLCGDSPTAADMALYGMIHTLDGDFYPGYPGIMEKLGATELAHWFDGMRTAYPIRF